MKTRSFLLAAATGVAGFTGLLAHSTSAYAQSSTTGAIRGIVQDSKTKEPLAGVTVIVTSPALAQSQTSITDDKGTYEVAELPPGVYLVTFYYAEITVKQEDVHVGVGKTVPVYQTINQDSAAGETIVVKGHPPTIDPTSTTQGITIDKDYIKNIPVPGRTFDALLGAAAGSQNDGYGTSFSGSTSLENQYIIDGVNTTGLTYGTVASPVINDFIEEIEVLTGGYGAEYGRATGGVVQVVTKTGSNEFKGSIFGTWQPGQLTAAAKASPINATSIDATANLNYNADFGFELGGPIIKDKLWFYVGFAPSYSQVDATRTVKSQTDCRVAANPMQGIPQGTGPGSVPGLSNCDPSKYQDGAPDIDPRTGFYITEPVQSEIRSSTAYTYNTLAKINYAATPEHQGQISFSALPNGSRNPGIFGPAATGFTTKNLVTDLSGKWTSKFNDNKTEIEAIVSWHRETDKAGGIDPTDPEYGDNQPRQILEDGDLNHWGPAFGEAAQVNQYGTATNPGCKDGIPGTGDPFPLIVNCPMSTRAYQIGGVGAPTNDEESRKSAALNITHRVKAAGSHEIKAGIDIEENATDHLRLYSGNPSTLGGVVITNDVGGGNVDLNRWVQLTSSTNTDPRFNQTCITPSTAANSAGPGAGNANQTFKCAYLGGTVGSPGTQIESSTLNWAAYVRDSWQIRPNLTLNVGVRYEEQRLRYASFLQNTVDPLTGDYLGKDAMTLTGNFAPRVGLLYDWTKEGRSKIYANWGRYYESIPLDINTRSFGGEVTYDQLYSSKLCGETNNMSAQIGGPDGLGCAMSSAAGDQRNRLLGASGELVAPGIKAEYLDEFIAGFEYEVIDDLKIGVAYRHRDFGRVIEDVSTDGANTYIIANPGDWSSQEQSKMEAQIAATDDPTEKQRLQNQLSLFEGIRIFDKPSRVYNALEFTVTRRFSKSLYVQGSYTYSRNEGNYPGSISYDNGQIDPNISSQFDLVELLENRVGPLPTDRPHYIKLDAYYTFDLKKAGDLTFGIRFRALSGIPQNALAGHYLYGPDESFLLPRGELGRGDFDHGIDLHVGYGKKLGKNMRIEVYADVFNLYNQQGTFAVDEEYAPYYKLLGIGPNGAPYGGEQQNANPVSGGTYSDLIWVKEIDSNGVEHNIPIGRNPDFGNTISRYAPADARFGVRLTF